MKSTAIGRRTKRSRGLTDSAVRDHEYSGLGRWSTIIGILVAGSLSAQTATRDPAPRFRDPVRLSAGEKLMGEARLYPSPIFYDQDGDGRNDILIGDLVGRITIATRSASEGPMAFAAEKVLKGADGNDLRFHNW